VPELVNPLEVSDAVTQEAAKEDVQTRQGVCGRSRDELVDADVDERGMLLSLRIPRHLLRGAHPERVCNAVVEAVANARHQAGQLARERAQAREGLAHSRRARPKR